MKIQRFAKHMLTPHGQVKRAFSPKALLAIETAIQASEALHAGEIRIAIEGALDGSPLFKGQSPRERALDVFSHLRVWDTENNNGLLIYVLLADRAVEIVADRGIHSKVSSSVWQEICDEMKASFRQSRFEDAVLKGIHAVTRQLTEHFPSRGPRRNELSDEPALL